MASEIRRLRHLIASSGFLALGSFASVVGAAVGVETDLADRGDVDHVVHPSVPGRERRCRFCSPEEASRVRCRSRRRTGCGRRTGRRRRRRPGSGRRRPVRHRAGPSGVTAGDHDRLELGGGLLDLGLTATSSAALRRDPAAGLAGDVTRSDAESIALAWPVVMSLFACPGSSSASSGWSRLTVWTRRLVSSRVGR